MARYKRIYSGTEDVASMDDYYSLRLAVSIPEAISVPNGTTGRFFATKHFSGISTTLTMSLRAPRPSEAVALQEAGFDENRLLDLAAPDRYLAYVRALEEYAGKPKGHYFSKELEEESASFERRHQGRAHCEGS